MLKVVLQDGKILRNRYGFYSNTTDEVISKEVGSLYDAADAVRDFIESNGIGAGCFTGGDVYDANGDWIAWVSYNGRIWDEHDKYGRARKMEVAK